MIQQFFYSTVDNRKIRQLREHSKTKLARSLYQALLENRNTDILLRHLILWHFDLEPIAKGDD